MANTYINILLACKEHLERDFGVSSLKLFGSVARHQEHEDSDVDILVDFKEDEAVGLFKYCSIMSGMTDVLGRNVDLVQNGTLLPFATKSVEQDKILIYKKA